MKSDINIEETLENMKLNIKKEELTRLLKRYEMNSILAEVEKLMEEKE